MFGESARFSGQRLYADLDARRAADGLSWAAVARGVWDLSAGLNARRPGDHPFSTSGIASLSARGNVSCQHALLMIWWLNRTPEDYVDNPAPETLTTAPFGSDQEHRLRWDLAHLYAAMDAARGARGVSWAHVASRLRCTTSQLTGLRTARYSTNMRLAMAITQALRRPAADFIYAAEW